MKIKLDENLPERLVAVLTGLGHNVDTVRTEPLASVVVTQHPVPIQS